jgi:hypothetical protein
MAGEGGSADRRAEELGSTGDPAAGAWAAGATGERRVAAALAHLPEAWTVLHDRLLRPGRSQANLDHVVIGPSGLYLVDAKNRAGMVVAWDGGLFQHTSRGGSPISSTLSRELAKVHGMAAYMAAESGLAVTPVLCLAGRQEAEFGAPQALRGVWVVPVSHLVTWLQSRPPVHDHDRVQRMATRVMTDFPSTTTDPELLAAMGAAALSQPSTAKGRRRHTGATGPVTVDRPKRAARRRRRPKAAGVWRGVLAFSIALASLWLLPAAANLAAAWAKHAAVVGHLATSVAQTSVIAPHGPSPTPGSQVRPSGSKPLAPTDCARASGAKIAHIIGRRIYPVAVTTGCAWGTRLDDPSTVVVSITMTADHSPFEYQFETSARQDRVVYGEGYDARYRPATTLWVARGARLVAGRQGARAVANIRVIVAGASLSLGEDQARRKALAIALAANS